jgi:hypothetical protein
VRLDAQRLPITLEFPAIDFLRAREAEAHAFMLGKILGNDRTATRGEISRRTEHGPVE